MNNHEIDYQIFGDDMQYVEVELDPQETVVAEAGALMMMDDAIHMETIFGDGSKEAKIVALWENYSVQVNDLLLVKAYL